MRKYCTHELNGEADVAYKNGAFHIHTGMYDSEIMGCSGMVVFTQREKLLCDSFNLCPGFWLGV